MTQQTHAHDRRVCSLLIQVFMALGTVSAVAQEKLPSPADATEVAHIEQKKADLRRQFMIQACNTFEMRIGDGEQSAIAKMVPEPVQRWDNTIATVIDGVITVYTRRSRPDVVAQFHIHQNRFVVNEFARICDEPLHMSRHGRTVWNPAEKWSEFKPLPNAPSDAGKTPELRLVQMRRQAERFSIRDERDGKVETATTLRLMPQPVYRYQDEEDLIDGAMFLFVSGVDPQAVLLVELRKLPKEKPSWHYVLAPVTIYELTASLDSAVVWQKPRVNQFAAINFPYFAGPYRPDPGDLDLGDLMPSGPAAR